MNQVFDLKWICVIFSFQWFLAKVFDEDGCGLAVAVSLQVCGSCGTWYLGCRWWRLADEDALVLGFDKTDVVKFWFGNGGVNGVGIWEMVIVDLGLVLLAGVVVVLLKMNGGGNRWIVFCWWGGGWGLRVVVGSDKSGRNLPVGGDSGDWAMFRCVCLYKYIYIFIYSYF